jgi:hypothetical protein
MAPLFQVNPRITLYRRFLQKKAAEIHPFLWVGLVVIFCIGPFPHIKELSEQLTMTPRARVAAQISHKKAFVEGVEALFLRDKDRQGLMKKLVIYGVEPEQALQIMNSVTQFSDKTKNNSSLDYAESQRNYFFDVWSTKIFDRWIFPGYGFD